MATVDQLDIKINASATEAVKSINQLCGCLDSLKSKLNLDISRLGLGRISAEVKNITNSLQTLNSIKSVNLSGITNEISKISKINGKEISGNANSIRVLASATNELNNSKFDNKNIISLLNATARLGKIDVDEKKFEKLGSSLKKMVNGLAGAREVSRTTSSIIGSVSRLANAGTKTNEAARALPLLKTNLNSLITTLSKAPAVTNGANELISSISRLASAGNRTKQTADNLDYLSVKLKSFMQSLRNAPIISSSTIKLVSAIASLANAGKSAGNMFSSTMSPINRFGSATKSMAGKLKTIIGTGIGNAYKMAGAGISAFTTRLKQHIPFINSTSKSTDTLIGKLGRLYIAYHSLRRIGRIFSKIVTSASDYIEEFNYFNVSVSKIAEEAKGDYKKYGYASAKEYADSFKERLTELTTKMSGFQIGENGELFTNAKIKNLGLDVTEVLNFESRIMQMTNSVGMLQESSIAASKGLTMLAGDLSSLANVPLERVMANLSSGLAGASTAVKKYGIDLSVATLGETALSLGIKKNISDMTQAEKEYLRVITIINQSKVAWGDLANTINQPANQFRMLRNNLKQISTLIGNLFMPAIQAVMPYLNAMANAVKDLIQWISDLFGLKWEHTAQAAPDMSEFDSGYDDLVSDAEDAADAIDDATDAQKKFNKQLSKFDELTNYTTNKTGEKDKDKDKDQSNADVSGILSNALITAVEDYEKRWNKAFKNMQSDVDTLTRKIEDLFTRAWETGDGSEIGGALAEWLNKGVNWVNEHTDRFSDGLNKIASILGTGLNGVVGKFGWPGLGTAVGNSIKAALEAEEVFFDTVDWSTLGSNLATSLNTAIETGVLEQYFSTMASKVRAAIETAFGAITTFNFEGLGSSIGRGINDFFNKMNEVNKKTGKNGWEELAISLSEGIKGALESTIATVTTIHWEDIGQAIATMISNMDTSGIGWDLGKLVNSLANAFYILVSKRDTWKLLGQKIADGINGFFSGMNDVDPKTGLTGWQALGKSISDTILGIGDMIITALDGVDWEAVGQSIADFITSIDWGGIIWKLGEVVASFAEALKKLLSGTGIPKPLANLIVNVGIGGWIIKKLSKTALGAAITGKLGKRFVVALLNVGARIKSWIASAVNKTGLKDKIVKGIGKITTTFKNVGAKIKNWLANGVNKTGLKAKIVEKVGKIVTTFKSVGAVIKGWLPTLGKGGKVKDLITGIKAALGITKGGVFSIGAIKTALSLKLPKLPTFVFPDPGTDDLVRQFDQWLYHALGDKDFIEFTVDIVLKVGKFIGNIKETIQEAFNAFMTGGEGGTPSISALVNYFTEDKETDQKNSSGGGKSFEDKEVKVNYKADTSELDKVTADDKDATVRYKADTKELQEANKLADANHENTTTFKTSHKELDKVIEKALKDIENITKFGTNTSSLDEAIAKAKKDRSNETTFKGKEGKSLKEKIEEAEANHENTTKFYADPAQKFIQMTKNWQTFKDNKEITTSVKFKATGDISKINSIINNVLIPSEKKFKITLDVATEGMGSAAVANLPWNKNKHAKGSTGLPADELGVVNDQSGNTYKELIIPPHGTPFIPEGRNVTLAMEKGTGIIPADRTKKFLNSLPHFANGTEDFDGDKKPKGGNSIAAGVSQAINDTLMPYIKEIVRALKNGGGTTVTTSGKKATTKYSDTVKEIQAAWLNLAKWFEDTVAKPIEKTFQTLKEQLLNVFDATNKELTEKYGEYATEWQDTLKEIPEWLKENVGDTIVEKFEELCSGLTEGLSGAWEEMQGILSSIPGWVESDVTSPFQGSFTSMFENIQGEHERLWGTIYSYSDKKLRELETRLGSINSSITSAKAEAESIQAEINSKTFDKITETITNTADTLSQTGGIQTAMQAITGKATAGKYIPSQTAKEEGKKEKTYHDSFVYWTPNKNETLNVENKKDTNKKFSSMATTSHTFETIKDTTNKAMERVADIINKNFSISNIADKLKVKHYATGGFPEDGWFRASHGEMIGQFDNGQSVVANNNQITNGIAIAVQEANREGNMLMRQELSMLRRQNELLMGILEKETGITQKDIFNAVRSENYMFKQRTGKSAFEY